VSAIAHHVVFRLQDDRVLAPSEAARRAWIRWFAAAAEALPILVWRLADTHGHVVVLGDLGVAEELVRRMRIWARLGAKLPVPIEVQRTKPILSQAYLESAFWYVLRQGEHHGVEVDRWQEAGALPDLLGMRRVSPRLPGRVLEHLPRTRRDRLEEILGATVEERVSADHLWDAACATFALDTLGKDPTGTRARRAAVAAAHELGANEISRSLGIQADTVSRLLRLPVEPRDVRAVRLQMGLRVLGRDAPLG
jgi:hypothetical protein